MSVDKELQKRSHSLCELCASADANTAYALPQSPGTKAAHHLWLCDVCRTQLNAPETADTNHWRCLNETIWSEEPAVKVVSWRMLHKLKHIDWVQDLLDIAYLDDDTLQWAKASGDHIPADEVIKHLDCYGAVLQNGDNVVLTKTLDVKGASFNAKVGTVVRKIHLVADNPEQIEGRVNNSMIVILTKYVKKSSAS